MLATVRNRPAAPKDAPAEASGDVVPLPVELSSSDAERRQLIAMFRDPVSSTALSIRPGPESLPELA